MQRRKIHCKRYKNQKRTDFSLLWIEKERIAIDNTGERSNKMKHKHNECVRQATKTEEEEKTQQNTKTMR